MTKIMIVEDDNSLREIYNIRLSAEGYEIVSAADGEEALAVAVRERPDLILADVMMPKISGFDMLDILRQTPETKDVKVIIMTALSSEDQRVRGENLGADRYLVKSQVGIEDVINTVHEVLGDREDTNEQAASEIAPEVMPEQAMPEVAPEVVPEQAISEVVPETETGMNNSEAVQMPVETVDTGMPTSVETENISTPLSAEINDAEVPIQGENLGATGESINGIFSA